MILQHYSAIKAIVMKIGKNLTTVNSVNFLAVSLTKLRFFADLSTKK